MKKITVGTVGCGLTQTALSHPNKCLVHVKDVENSIARLIHSVLVKGLANARRDGNRIALL